ncbi:hypothetical protein K435DRAFT_841451 [Dendrothele bispora CBS 962.96]|uniref:Uncharacterized protein n=1 Tax=Dendrothele bispora (strain CBS 962.96) TaxID=1314807 RepID=A0A4S8LMM2_DENBC|nr:hypothetical protein K435DRAFT_841451 [Dendrothele bispora CBS 962.96]
MPSLAKYLTALRPHPDVSSRRRWRTRYDKRSTKSVKPETTSNDINHLFVNQDSKRSHPSRGDTVTRKTLQKRTLELQSTMKSKNTITDTLAFSGEDVKRLLMLLNAHISLFASQIVLNEVQLQDTRPGSADQIEDLQLDIGRASEDIEDLLGDVSLYLCKENGEVNGYEFVMQHALQALLSGWCVKIIQKWSWSEETDRVLKEMYDRLRATKSPETFRKWRAVTRAQCKLDVANVESDEYLKVVKRAANSVIAFEILFEPDRPIISGKQAWISEKVASILHKACQIREIIGEKIISADYEVLCPRFGDPWDESSMNDIYDRRPDIAGKNMSRDRGSLLGVKSQQGVFCTSQMGLQERCYDISEDRNSYTRRTKTITKVNVIPLSSL